MPNRQFMPASDTITDSASFEIFTYLVIKFLYIFYFRVTVKTYVIHAYIFTNVKKNTLLRGGGVDLYILDVLIRAMEN